MTKKRRWNDVLETNKEMGINNEQDLETKVMKKYQSQKKRTILNKGGDLANGLVNNSLMTMSLQQIKESNLEDYLPKCKEKQDQNNNKR
jgi:hypothetical protein